MPRKAKLAVLPRVDLQSSWVLHETLHDSDKAKAKHIDRQPYMRFELLQQDIAWNFEKAIRDKEDGKCYVVAIADVKIKVLYQVEYTGVADVDAIEEGEHWQAV